MQNTVGDSVIIKKLKPASVTYVDYYCATYSKETTTGKPSAASSFDTDLYSIIGAVLAVAVIGAVFTTIFRKRK